MKKIAFVNIRPKPLPRNTVHTKFLFSHNYEYWKEIDEANEINERKGLINRNGKKYKKTTLAKRFKRLRDTMEYKDFLRDSILEQNNNKIPYDNIIIIFLLLLPKGTSKKNKILLNNTPHRKRPDISNLMKAFEDACFIEDSIVNCVAQYKLWTNDINKQGVLLLQSQEIHNAIIENALTFL